MEAKIKRKKCEKLFQLYKYFGIDFHIKKVIIVDAILIFKIKRIKIKKK